MALDRINTDIKEGLEIEGFLVKRILELPKLKNTFYELEHQQTNSNYIHLSNEDENNCFAVAFKTTPTDSTGVAHILEHTALCGSKKYPVRDPFFSMIRRSMKTFMNAFTASDWTMYPFSSQNKIDYYNLMQVYLDAAFFPELSELSFLQEGHRLEFLEEGNPNSPLVIKGIVYNEMKGAMSSQSSRMYKSVSEALYPSITYHYNSGGEPSVIPELTWEGLKHFHQTHYHPSNAWFYTYGNLPLKPHLKMIQENVLSQFQSMETHTEVTDENRYSKPKECKFSYPLTKNEDDGKKHQIAIAWLTCKITDPLEILSLQLISQILMGNAAAPLRKKLLESQLGKALADTSGFEDDLRETFFSVGLQGVHEKDFQTVETLIFDTLKEVVKNGIDSSLIDSAVHQMELDIREISGGSYPYSLNLLFRFFGTWIHGGDPITSIDFDTNLEKLLNLIQKESFLEQQIQKYLLDNPHRVKVILSPDHALTKKENIKLEKKLEKIKKNLNKENVQKILNTTDQLKKLQETEEDLSVLPSLTLQDIPKTIQRVKAPEKRNVPCSYTIYDQPTNGLNYYNWYFQLPSLTTEEREFLPMFSNLLTKCGAGDMAYDQLSLEIGMYTGGISATPNLQKHYHEEKYWTDFFTVSSKCLERNQKKLFELVKTILTEWDLSDLNRVQNLIAQRSNSLSNSIVEAGHSYALSLAKRFFSTESNIDEIYSGIHQVKWMKNLLHADEEFIKKFTHSLKTFAEKIFHKNNLSFLIIGEEENTKQVKPIIEDFFQALPAHKADKHKNIDNFIPRFINEVWLTTTPVSYVARSFLTGKYQNRHSPKLQVLSNLLQAGYLHREIREKGGAYGGMATYNSEDGVFSLLSYRDPQFADTLNRYDGAIEWVLSGNFTNQDIEEAILQTCSKMDTPLSPASKAGRDFSNEQKHKTYEMQEAFRKEILNCSKKDLIQATEIYLTKDFSTVTITSQDIYDRDKNKLKQKELEIFHIEHSK